MANSLQLAEWVTQIETEQKEDERTSYPINEDESVAYLKMEYRCFTSEKAFKRYVENEILVLEPQ